MSIPRRRLGRLAGVLIVAAAATLAAAAPAAAAGSSISIQTLKFMHPNVDATSTVVNTLTFTIADSHRQATGIGGDLFIRQQGSAPGTFIGDTYDVFFSFGNSGFGGATFVSGSPQNSTYTYDFVVPTYANAAKATWIVSKVVISDGLAGGNLNADPANLGHFQDSFTAKENIDTIKPSYQMNWDTNSGPSHRPYLFLDGTHPVRTGYTVDVQDGQSGFWKGSLQLLGPTGQTVVAPFAYVEPNAETTASGCGFSGGGTINDTSCGVDVAFPADAAPGVWNVVQVSLTDNAGNRFVDKQPDTTPITLTSNSALAAHDFSVTPNPVDDWIGDVTVQVGMTVTGATGGVSAIYVESDGVSGCFPGAPTPTVGADGTVSVQVRMFQRTPSCPIEGIAVVDGAGNIALYGPDYGAPDPGLTITNIPDTVAPVATAASLSATTISDEQISRGPDLLLIVQVASQIAPVDEFSIDVYDVDGNVVGEEFGGTGVLGGLNGTMTEGLPLPFFLAPGTYTVGFSITDEGGLTSTYGISGVANSQPLPSGPLSFTVTP
jgi:hypothetical protein